MCTPFKTSRKSVLGERSVSLCLALSMLSVFVGSTDPGYDVVSNHDKESSTISIQKGLIVYV